MSLEIYRVLPAPEHLRPFVRRMFVFDSQENVVHSSSVRPTGRGYLGWVFRGECVFKREEQVLNDLLLSGFLHSSGQVRDTGISVNYSGKIGHVFAEFTALGFFQLLGITGAQGFERCCSPLELNPALVDDLAPVLEQSDRLNVNAEQALTGLIGCLTNLAKRPREVATYIIDAVNTMEAAEGAIPISIVNMNLPVSIRQFTREFTRLVGVSPKYYCKTLQLNHAIEEMVENDGKGLSQIAIQMGFFGQAHFNKMFRKVMDSSPLGFLNGDEDLLITMLSNRIQSN